ncbi:hypothetical protein ACFXKC_47545 [Streptomyces sp. NPDC059340]|uniref:hypothetical protein n=1 Tax=Streptomyces sp. NPDC059340 TaxID=3346806 RepID=UPI0036922C53
MSWGELAQNIALAHADYSKESFDQTLQNSEQGWKDAGRDVMTSHTLGPMGLNPENLHGAFGVSDSEYNQVLDDTFGPSPEERGLRPCGRPTQRPHRRASCPRRRRPQACPARR